MMNRRTKGRVRPDPTCVLALRLYQHDGSVFPSDDAYGQLCTATGTIWGSRGRTFDGVDDNIAVAGVTTILNGGTRSLMVWFKVRAFTNTSGYLGSNLRLSGGVNSYGFGLRTTSAGTTIDAVCHAADNSTALVTQVITTGTWYCALLTHDGTTLTLYLNGVLAGTPTGCTGFATSDKTFYLGCYPNDIANVLYIHDGEIGEELAFNRALSPSEVSSLYQVTKWRYQ